MIKARILRLDLAPGSSLNERSLANEMGVSQTTVRNAFDLLEKDGLLIRKKGLSAESIRPDNTSIRNLYQFHYILTKGAAAQAAVMESFKDYAQDMESFAEKADEIAFNYEKDIYEAVNDEIVFHRSFVEMAGNTFFSSAEKQICDRLYFYTMLMYRSEEFKACFAPGSAGHGELWELYKRGVKTGNMKVFDASLKLHMARNMITDWGEKAAEDPYDDELSKMMILSSLYERHGKTLTMAEEYEIIRKNDPFMSVKSAVAMLFIDSLMKGRFGCHTEVNISHIADELEISRNPVRQAAEQLIEYGYLKRDKNKKIYPSEMNSKVRMDLYIYRLIFEPYAARLAAENANEKELDNILKTLMSSEKAYRENDVSSFVYYDGLFHLEITCASHNSYMAKIYRSILVFSRMAMNEIATKNKWTAENLSERVREHRKIYAAVKNRRKELSYEYAKEHMLKGSEQNMDIHDKRKFIDTMDFYLEM